MNRAMGWAVGLVLAGGCAPGELEPEPSPALTQASAYVVAPTCGPAKVSSLRAVLPDDKLMGAMEIDMQALQASPLFRDNRALLEAEAKDVLDGMKACGLPLSKVERVVAGFNESSDMVLGIRAPGVGRPKTLDCLARKIERATGEPAWSRTTTGCSTTLQMDGGEKGFAVGRDMLVITSTSMADAVKRRIDGKDRSLLDGRLGWARRDVDMSRTAWVASNIPPGTGAGISGSMSGLLHGGLSIDASKGLGLKMTAGFGTSREAEAAKSEMETFALQARAMLPMLGLPSSVADSITIGSVGTVVSLGVFLSASDVEALQKSMGGSTSSGSSGSGSSSPRKGM